MALPLTMNGRAILISLTQIFLRVFDASNDALKVELVGNYVQNLSVPVAADLRVAVFDGTSGLVIKDGGKTIAEILASAGGTSALRFTVGGTIPNQGATLDVQGVTGGIGFPALTTAQRDTIATPARSGVVIFNVDNARFEAWILGAWTAPFGYTPPSLTQEVPTDSGDHVNHTLAHTPSSAVSVRLYRNGVFLRQVASAPNADQYTITGNAIALGAALNADQIGGLDAIYSYF